MKQSSCIQVHSGLAGVLTGVLILNTLSLHLSNITYASSYDTSTTTAASTEETPQEDTLDSDSEDDKETNTTIFSQEEQQDVMESINEEGGTSSSTFSSTTSGSTSVEATSSPVPIGTTATSTEPKNEDLNETTVGTSTATSTSSSSIRDNGSGLLTEHITLESTTTPPMSTTLESDGLEVHATTSTSSVSIRSGEAIALANIINILNSNFINSDGVVFFSNFLDAVMETLDLRRFYDAFAEFGCSLINCGDDSMTVNISNDASIDNYLYLNALTGGNSISGVDSGSIYTGNAYAGLNLVNVANMNFIDSNYLLVTINAFDDMNGDIVFPSADALLSNLSYGPEDIDITLSNIASVQNEVEVNGDTGNNTLDTTNGGTIATGTSTASSNIFNQLNSSLIGGQNITLLFRIHGDWGGEVFGAPDDLLWEEAPDGSVLLFNADGGRSDGQNSSGSLTVNGANNTSIHNTVKVVALTGENRISEADTGSISTGDALASANIINLANGTVVGRNWILAIINIFGDFNGNIAFGRPDLWVGETITAPPRIQNGSKVTYTYTVLNNGDSTATKVVLNDTYELDHVRILDASLPFTETEGGKLRFELGSLPPGKGVEVTYTAEIRGVKDRRKEITNSVSVTARETDDNTIDNSDTATLIAVGKSTTYGTKIRTKKETTNQVNEMFSLGAQVAGISTSTSPLGLTVRRMFMEFPLTAEYPAMRQFITVVNDTNRVIPSVAYADILKDPNGNELKREVWDLGDVLPNEVIELGYTLAFQSTAATGTWHLSSGITSGNMEERQYENGKVWFTKTKMIEEGIEKYIDITPLQSSMISLVPLGVPVRGIGHIESRSTNPWRDPLLTFLTPMFLSEWNRYQLPLPTLSTHSMSTATQQQEGQRESIARLFTRLAVSLSALVSKVTVGMNL